MPRQARLYWESCQTQHACELALIYSRLGEMERNDGSVAEARTFGLAHQIYQRSLPQHDLLIAEAGVNLGAILAMVL